MSASTASSISDMLVLRLIRDDEPVFLGEIAQRAARTFGPDAKYHTCQRGGLTLEAMVAELTTKGKLLETAAGLRLGHGCPQCKV